MEELSQVIIYTDGACDPNPGKGGYGVVLLFGKHREELTGGFRHTTNNRMEIYAVLAGLQALKEQYEVTVYSDSKYVVNSMTKGWAKEWQAKGWKKKVKNPDLWEKMLELCEKHKVVFEWVQGHNGNPENERCDFLSMQALREINLPADTYFEESDSWKPSNTPYKMSLF